MGLFCQELVTAFAYRSCPEVSQAYDLWGALPPRDAEASTDSGAGRSGMI